MDVTRRDWMRVGATLGAAVLGLVAPAQAAPRVLHPGARGRDYSGTIARVQAFAEAELAQKGFPGMSIAIVGADRFSAVIPVGYAEAERRLPVTADHLFQIGSLSKSALALAVFALVDKGKIDLDARVQELLPDYPLPPEPITVAQLLDHSSGLPAGTPAFPDVPGGRLWTGFPPGSRFHYSNLGYVLLGAVVEAATGKTAADVIETMVLRPLGMNSARPVIRVADRAHYASGYLRKRDDLPWMPGAPLAQAQWFDWDAPSGAIGATPGDMSQYLAFLVKLGRGKGAPLFSDGLARRFITPSVEAPLIGAGGRYGNGMGHRPLEGRPTLYHAGGTPGFTSSLTVDAVAGVGCYAAVNVGGGTGYRPGEVTDFACTLLRAHAEGREIEARQPRRPPPVANPERFTGRWVSSGGELRIVERGGDLFVISGGEERPLRAAGATAVATDHPSLPSGRLSLENGAMPLLRAGDQIYGRDRAPPRQPPADPQIARLAGSYYNPAIWDSRMRVTAIGNSLFIGAQRATQAADGSWRLADPERAPDRAWFENFVGGRPQRLNMSGNRFERVHDREL